MKYEGLMTTKCALKIKCKALFPTFFMGETVQKIVNDFYRALRNCEENFQKKEMKYFFFTKRSVLLYFMKNQKERILNLFIPRMDPSVHSRSLASISEALRGDTINGFQISMKQPRFEFFGNRQLTKITPHSQCKRIEKKMPKIALNYISTKSHVHFQ